MTTQTQLPKSKLVETAADLIYRQGWNATGINQILTEAKVPKGSFYYYFQSKEDLGVAIVKYHADQFQELYKTTLLNANLSGGEAIKKYFEIDLEKHRRHEWRFGCPIGSFSNEVATSTEKITLACREALEEMSRALVVAIERGQKDGSISKRNSPQKLAQDVAATWQGAQLFMKTFRRESAVLDGFSAILSLLA